MKKPAHRRAADKPTKRARLVAESKPSTFPGTDKLDFITLELCKIGPMLETLELTCHAFASNDDHRGVTEDAYLGVEYTLESIRERLATVSATAVDMYHEFKDANRATMAGGGR